MSEVIQCDWCGATTKPGAQVNWYAVELSGMTVTTADKGAGPWHFCSSGCLETWAAPAQEEGTQGPGGYIESESDVGQD